MCRASPAWLLPWLATLSCDCFLLLKISSRRPVLVAAPARGGSWGGAGAGAGQGGSTHTFSYIWGRGGGGAEGGSVEGRGGGLGEGPGDPGSVVASLLCHTGAVT